MSVKEIASWPKYYESTIMVYAPDWYHCGNSQNHHHSQKIISSKGVSDESIYFIPLIQKLFQEINLTKQNVNLVAIVPKSNLNFSSTLNSIANWIQSSLGIKYDKVIDRIKNGRRNKYCQNYEDRFNQTTGSMVVNRKLSDKEKTVLILDDTKATGMTILECIKILKESGAVNFYAVCLGINRKKELGY